MTPRISFAALIAPGPQPARSQFLGLLPSRASNRLPLAADPPRRRGLQERLSGIRTQARAAKVAAKVARREVAARLSTNDVDFLRDIGAL